MNEACAPSCARFQFSKYLVFRITVYYLRSFCMAKSTSVTEEMKVSQCAQHFLRNYCVWSTSRVVYLIPVIRDGTKIIRYGSQKSFSFVTCCMTAYIRDFLEGNSYQPNGDIH